MRIKISELPSGTAEQNAVVPATNASGSATRKVKMGEIAALATKQTVGLGDVDNTSDANKPVSTAVQIALDGKAPLSNPTFTGTVGGITKGMVGLGDVDNTSDANKPVSSAMQTALDNKQASGSYATLTDGKVPSSQLPSYVDDVIEATNLAALPISGETGKIYVTLDSNKVYRWSGSAYVEISPSPGSTDSVTEGSVNLYYTNARASAAAPVQSVAGRIGTVSLTKSDVGLGNVDNTSDANKPVSSATQTALDLKAPINDPTFTGTVGGVTKSMVGLGNVDNTSDASKPVSTAMQTALDGKASSVHNHVIGDVTGLQTALDNKQDGGNYATLVNGTVPSSQLPSYVDDVIEATNLAALPISGETGKIYVTLDSNKVYRWSGSSYVEISASPGSTDSVTEGSVNLYYTNARASAAAPVQSVAGRTGAVTLIKSDVGLGNVDNTSDANKPVSSATQTALDSKAPIASPTFTGTVGGVTKSMVGLGNVDNTSDANKPVSSATQTALDLKAPINNPTFTGTVGGISKSMVGLGNVDNTSDANKPVSTATQTALGGKVSSSAVAVSLGKTLSVLNSITFSSTDGSVVNLGAGGSVLYSNSIIDGGQY